MDRVAITVSLLGVLLLFASKALYELVITGALGQRAITSKRFKMTL